jgi:hypothetical protein
MSEIDTSILRTVKKYLGIQPDYYHFDPEIIMHINSTITILVQLGACDPMVVHDDSDDWSDLINNKDPNSLELIKSYISLRTKTLFDPPSSAFVLDSIERQIKEFEWRINCMVDPKEE